MKKGRSSNKKGTHLRRLAIALEQFLVSAEGFKPPTLGDEPKVVNSVTYCFL